MLYVTGEAKVPKQGSAQRPFTIDDGRLGHTFTITERDGKPAVSGTVERLFYREDWTVSEIKSSGGETWPIPQGSTVEPSCTVFLGDTTADTAEFSVVSLAGSGRTLWMGPSPLFM